MGDRVKFPVQLTHGDGFRVDDYDLDLVLPHQTLLGGSLCEESREHSGLEGEGRKEDSKERNEKLWFVCGMLGLEEVKEKEGAVQIKLLKDSGFYDDLFALSATCVCSLCLD